MSKLYVVLHTQVEINPFIPASNWHLSKEGRFSTLHLAQSESWEDAQWIYSSCEPKAIETAQIIAEHLQIKQHTHPDLRELHFATAYLPANEFQNRIARYLEGKPDPAFEDYQKAQTRMDQCVKSIIQEQTGSSGIIVSHGRIITAWYSLLLGRRLTAQEWKSIKLPDLSVIDLLTWKIERGFISS